MGALFFILKKLIDVLTRLIENNTNHEVFLKTYITILDLLFDEVAD